MKLKTLREQVLDANLELVRRGLVIYTFGNASGIDRQQGLVVIKPSGVSYEKLTPSDLVVTDLEGTIVEGSLRPSSDLPTHLVLYRAWTSIGGVAHTHSRTATAWAQALREIPCYGVTHAGYFNGPVPVTAPLSKKEIRAGIEINSGHSIVRRFRKLDPAQVPGVLLASHAPFTWGADVSKAVYNAVMLEEIARLALESLTIRPKLSPVAKAMLDSHFSHKNGPNAGYGQK
jgi:L-ribulose-5-phosphate 4-epimerase